MTKKGVKMTWKDVIDCLREGEGPQIEFVSSILSAEQLIKYITGFLNHNGGKIIIGIDDKNDHLIGSNISKNFIETSVQKIDPAVTVYIEEIARLDKIVILIKVPEGSHKPYSYRNKYYFRSGIEIKKMAKEEIYSHVGQEQSVKLNQRQEQCLKYVKEKEFVTNKTYRNLYNISHKTAHIELTALFTMGILEKIGQGRSTSYKLKTSK
ncbi:MAG: putative DNA binding domain-containing protein [Candidatus Margulisbacteria bacterium]|nr:putative DNA binding domain-containing protein [Candidatus Margulisiibacteriota bacterium]